MGNGDGRAGFVATGIGASRGTWQRFVGLSAVSTGIFASHHASLGHCLACPDQTASLPLRIVLVIDGGRGGGEAMFLDQVKAESCGSSGHIHQQAI